MSSNSWQRVQAFYELSEWQVTVRSGEQITIYADSVSEEEGNLIFYIAVAGSPISQLPVVKIPANLVHKYESIYVGLADPPDEHPS
jgi:transposase